MKEDPSNVIKHKINKYINPIFVQCVVLSILCFVLDFVSTIRRATVGNDKVVVE